MLPELLHDIAIPAERVTYTILLVHPQRHAAAGAAIAYGVEIILALDDAVD